MPRRPGLQEGGASLALNLKTRVGSLELRTPLMPASGTFGYGDEYLEIVPYDVLGAIVTKSLSLYPKEGNPPPRIHEFPWGVINSIGLENIGLEAFLKEKLPKLEFLDVPVVVSIFGETEGEFALVAKGLSGRRNVKALEVNLSCPNVKGGGAAFGTDPEKVYRILMAIREVTDLPLWAKLPPDPFHILTIAQAAKEGGAEALTLTNTLPGMVIDVERSRPLLGGVSGGLSGPALFPVSLKIVYDVFSIIRMPIVASGGVCRTEDVLAFLMAGASAVQVGTALFSNPKIFTEIAQGIERFLRQRGRNDLSAIIGSAHVMEDPPL